MRSKRAEFTDQQKAEIYVRDRALCSFSGLSLWLLDYGWIDWVDHMHPAAQRGRADLKNAACASGLYNKAKGTGSGVYLFREGRPTDTFFIYHGTVPLDVARHLRRFARLHVSDWYFNRAVFHTFIAAEIRAGLWGGGGKRIARRLKFQASSTLNFLNKWRQIIEVERPPSMKARGLIPRTPSPDQKILLQLLHATTTRDVGRISKTIAPYLKASSGAISSLSEVTTPAEAKALLSEVRHNRFVTPPIRRTVELNLRRLGLLSKSKGRDRKCS